MVHAFLQMLYRGRPKHFLFKLLVYLHNVCLSFLGKDFSLLCLHLFCCHLTDILFVVTFREKTEMAVRLFDALKLETQSLRSTIQEAIISLAAAYKVCYFNVISTNYHFIFYFDPYDFT